MEWDITVFMAATKILFSWSPIHTCCIRQFTLCKIRVLKLSFEVLICQHRFLRRRYNFGMFWLIRRVLTVLFLWMWQWIIVSNIHVFYKRIRSFAQPPVSVIHRLILCIFSHLSVFCAVFILHLALFFKEREKLISESCLCPEYIAITTGNSKKVWTSSFSIFFFCLIRLKFLQCWR